MIRFICLYTQQTKLPLLISRSTKVLLLAVLKAEENRVSTCAKSNNRVYLFNALLIMQDSKYEIPSYIGSLTSLSF